MNDSTQLAELKRRLAELATAEPTDFEAILRLSGDIAKMEPGVVRFTTDAAMVRRLGRELVAKQETALGELVKNAYDADATSCTVRLVQRGGSAAIEIIDDGSGMNENDIVNGFMRLASDSKVLEPRSPRFGRSRAGKKGIGRFATERLGSNLRIVTQTEHEETGWTVDVDWSSFHQGAEISQVANSIRSSPKERPNGTRISIDGLKDSWTDADLRRVYRYLSTLLQPFSRDLEPGSAAEPTPATGDPGFVVQISRDDEFIDEPSTIASTDTEVLRQALAVITATIDDEGATTWSMSCPKLELEVAPTAIGLDRNAASPLPHARRATMRAYYYIRARDFLGHLTSYIREVLDEHGGIKLYRNGYRVPPYGEPGDDWLGLEVKRTTTYAPMSTKTFLGFVALDDAAGVEFEETSSREGLIETPAFAEVRDIMSRVLEAAVRRIESKRGLGRRRPDRHDPTEGDRAANETDAALAHLEDVISGNQAADGGGEDRVVASALARLGSAVRTSAEAARERDALLEELNLMRILASMGLTIAEFTHDFSHLAQTMEINLNMLASRAKQGRDIEQPLERFRGQFRQVRAYTAHFGNMMTSNASRELAPIDLYAYSRGFSEDLSVMFGRRGLELIVEPPADYDVRTIDMHPSEWSSILLNLLTNAMKAADRAQRPGRFLIRMGHVAPASVFLEFCDNGDGIPPNHRESIFTAFFTTTGGSPMRANETARALGTGLGLKIVADIAIGAGGSAAVTPAPPGYETCIRVTVPAANTTGTVS